MIRTAVLADFPAIFEIAKQVQDIHHGARPDVFREEYFGEDIEACLKWEEENLDDNHMRTFVCEKNDKIIGFVVAEIYCWVDHPNHNDMAICRITNFCVDKSERNKGVGQMLFDHVKSYAKENGTERLELTVWNFNEDARRFYERQGLSVRTMTMDMKI
ncbi:MAG: GNAT family N-acetyltransferase [Oscillospiraceae bacterium]|nr:GNAT family N-acetyltransferase [Oscillospiraceae bacterium]